MTQSDIAARIYQKIFHPEETAMSKIIKNDRPDVIEALKETNGYCPCAILQNEDTKCMCREFREMEAPATCHCGLYTKVKE